MTKATRVTAFPRVHVTLVDLAGVTPRRYGGAGFSLGVLPVRVKVEPAARNKLVTNTPLSDHDAAGVRDLMQRISSRLDQQFSVEVNSLPPAHVGFGSKTALILSICAACNTAAGSPLSQVEIQKLSHRGGASGVGINAFFCGGFLTDLGHPQGCPPTFEPSSAVRPTSMAPVGIRCDFPSDWEVHLFLAEGNSYFGATEQKFFRKFAPIPDAEALSVLASLYHGLVPAVIEADHKTFKAALAAIQNTGFKRREILGQTAALRKALDDLNTEEFMAAGMSSLGPLVFAIAPKDYRSSAIAILQGLQASRVGSYLSSSEGRNLGHKVG